MIRRELKLSGDEVVWLLVSQVEHAHMSGELVRHWHEPYSPDVVEAVWHHDDGWAGWEEAPKLNPATGAPVSFLEMPIAESLVIWDNSIAAARKIGPLAGWIVAGHFYNLLADSEHANEPPAIAWLTAKRKVRTAWLDEWVRADKSHTLEYAKQAQQMLLTADLFSLWLCCECPIDGGDGTNSGLLGKSAMKLRADKLLAEFHFVSPECTIRESVSKKRIEGLSWIVPVKPYPIGVEPLSVKASATMVPLAHYESWQQLVTASWPVELNFRLLPAVGD